MSKEFIYKNSNWKITFKSNIPYPTKNTTLSTPILYNKSNPSIKNVVIFFNGTIN